MPTIFDLVWYGDTTLQLKYYEEVVCAPFGRWVGEYKFYGAKLSVFHCGAKLSVFTWRCQIVRFYMTVPNCPRCQIVRFTWRCQIVRVPNCPFLHCGAKLSVFHCGAKLSAVPNCPRCQIVLESHGMNSLWNFFTFKEQIYASCTIHNSLYVLQQLIIHRIYCSTATPLQEMWH